MPLDNPFGEPMDDPVEDHLGRGDNELFDDEDESELAPRGPPVACKRTKSFKAFHKRRKTTGEEWRMIVLDVLDYMHDHAIDLPLLLHHLLWNTPELVDDGQCRYERTALTHCDELKGILRNLYRPPRRHGSGVRSRGAVEAMTEVAGEIITRQVNREMRALGPIMEAKPDDFTEEKLLAIRLSDLIPRAKAATPLLWSICRNAAFTPQQAARNTKKNDPDTAILMIMAILSFSRSAHRCKLQQLVTFYVKACGGKSRLFDSLHALFITLSQKTVYTALDKVAGAAQKQMQADVTKYAIRGSHDNINIRFQAYEQRSDNKSHFDSGTAATVYPVKDPDAVPPNAAAYRTQRAAGAQSPITPFHIYELEVKASPRIHSRAIYQILRFLLDSAPFDLASYEHKDSELLKPPPPVYQLPTGPQHATSGYMCGTIHQEEASYDGNEKCMREWLRQLGLDPPDAMEKMSQHELIVWMGDQLTSARFRGLKKFKSQDLNSAQRFEWLIEQPGWFHYMVNLGFSFHHQYWGKAGSMGLKHAADLLQRKNVAAPSVQGNFHHHNDELLQHTAEAHIRDAWCTITGVTSLDQLRSRSPEELVQLANEVCEKLASTRALHELRDKKPPREPVKKAAPKKKRKAPAQDLAAAGVDMPNDLGRASGSKRRRTTGDSEAGSLPVSGKDKDVDAASGGPENMNRGHADADACNDTGPTRTESADDNEAEADSEAPAVGGKRRGRKPKKTDIIVDDHFEQAVMFNRDMLDYLDLDDAIKTGDVGRVRDLLPRLLFRFIGGGQSNYVIETLELIQALECEWPEDLKVWVLRYCWLGNTTGRPGCFAPFDLMQEHNIRDIKHIFAVFGPYATWEYIKKISAAIPTMRKVKDHVEAEINHFRRGKSHTKPPKEKDVAKLQEAYAMSKVHVYDPSRPCLGKGACTTDYLYRGSRPDILRATIERWSARRDTVRSTEQDWTDYLALAAADLATILGGVEDQDETDDQCDVFVEAAEDGSDTNVTE